MFAKLERIAFFSICFHTIGCLRVQHWLQTRSLPHSNSTFYTDYLTQNLDNFDALNNATYNQRYHVNLAHAKNNGPVFIYIGGEGPLENSAIASGHTFEMGVEYGAYMVALEHRYYGRSLNRNSLELENLKYLSSEQALADIAVFKEFIMKNLSLPRDTKWVSFGGSYPGSLSAWLRIMYPNVVHAAVASSAPVRAKVDFYEYQRSLTEAFENPEIGGSQLCLNTAASGYRKLLNFIKKKSYKLIGKEFVLCEPITSENDIASFSGSISDIIAGVVQYNNVNSRTGPQLNVKSLCDVFTSLSDDPYKALIAVTKTYLNVTKATCIDASYKSMINDLLNDTYTTSDSDRQWVYQTCAEFGYFQSCEKDCITLPMNSLKFNEQLCQDVYGLHQMTQRVDRTNSFYGSNNPKGSRIIFVNGSVDPWHNLSVLENLTDDQIAIFINGTAHCADMGDPLPTDPPQLTAARLHIAEEVGKFLELD